MTLTEDISASILREISEETLAKLRAEERALAKDSFAATARALLRKEPDALEKAADHLFRFCDSAKRPWEFLDLAQFMNGEAFWRALFEHWPSFDAIPHARFVRVFTYRRSAWKSDYMADADRDAFSSLDDAVTVYRGQNARARVGLSWTLDRSVAEGFARGHRWIRHLHPIVITASVSKRDIAAVCLDREESEIVLFNATAAKKRQADVIQPREA